MTTAEFARRRFLDALPLLRADRLVAGEALPDRFSAVCLGKAAVAMASALRGPGPVLAVTKDEAPVPGVEVVYGSHPVPDERSLAAGERVLAWAASRPAEEAVVVGLSGGASALAETLREGWTLERVRERTRELLAAGADIGAINAERRRWSRLKAGGLAAALGDRPVLVLVLSDVLGSGGSILLPGPGGVSPPVSADLDRDGPTTRGGSILLPGPGGVSPPASATDLEQDAPGTRERDAPTTFLLKTIASGPCFPEGGPGPNVVHRILGDNALARRAVGGLVHDLPLTGEAKDEGARLGRLAMADGPPLETFGGEPVVTFARAGRGGRAQEAALAAAIVLDGRDGPAVLCAGTDGSDGPTDATGAVVDGGTCARIRAAGLDPARALAEHDAYPALDAAGALIRTGPTGTNLNDLFLIVRRSAIL